MKKIIHICLYRLISTLFIFLTTVCSFAEYVYYEDMKYDVKDKQATLIRGKGGTVIVPKSIRYQGNDCPVTGIGSKAFQSNDRVTSVEIPNSVKTIGPWAFMNCSKLRSVAIPSSIKILSSYTFQDCTALKSIKIPNSVTSIGFSTFQGTALTAIAIPSSVKSIGGGAFLDCTSLASVTCLPPTPPEQGEGMYIPIFDSNTYENGKLYVPSESVPLYRDAFPWYYFSYIEDLAGMEEVTNENGVKVWNDHGVLRVEGAEVPCEVYDMQGRLVTKTSESSIYGLSHGIYLVKIGPETVKISL